MNITDFVYAHWGIIGILVYVAAVVHGKAIWRLIRGTYVSYENLERRITKLESDIVAHGETDKAQFNTIKDNMEMLQSRVQSYFQTLGSDTKDRQEEIKSEIKSISTRVDEIWGFLGRLGK